MSVSKTSRGAAPDIERSALLPYRPEDLFALVNDIEKYPKFLPGCSAAEVQHREGNLVEASLTLSGAGLHYELSSRNHLFPPHRMTMELHDGILKMLFGEWSFSDPPSGDPGCLVHLRLYFQLKSGFLRRLASRFSETAADRLVQAMCDRADALYSRSLRTGQPASGDDEWGDR